MHAIWNAYCSNLGAQPAAAGRVPELSKRISFYFVCGNRWLLQ
jgi:hypothetical protein